MTDEAGGGLSTVMETVMCDLAKCENCGATKRRPRMRPCPEGWLYIETHIDEAESDGIITWACSRPCMLALWQAGPGPIMTEEALIEAPSSEAPENVKR